MYKEYWKLYFDDVGYSFRMTYAQATAGIEQLKKKLKYHNQRRIEIAIQLTEKLNNVTGITLPENDPNGKCVWHLYVIQLVKGFPMTKHDIMWNRYTKKG